MTPAPAGHGVTVRVSAPVYPTETPERVAAAIHGVFPDVELDVDEARVSGRLTDPAILGEIVQRLRIPDTARGQLFKGRTGNRSVVFLHKQAATVGRFNFVATPGPLGDIRVEVEAPDDDALEAFIMAVAPDTRSEEYRDPGFQDPDEVAEREEDPGAWRRVPGPWRAGDRGE